MNLGEITFRGRIGLGLARRGKARLGNHVSDTHGAQISMAMQCAAWLAGLGMTAYSQKHHRANVNKMFEWLMLERLADRNPCATIPVPEEDWGEINLLTVEQARKLFAANRRHRSIGRLALETFAGLRTSSAARLVYDDIKFDRLGIELPGDKHKTRRRHYIDGLPANLWAWLKHAPKAGWKILPRVYAEDKRTMFERAGLKKVKEDDKIDDEAMRNVLRHSFASYHVAANKDPGKTALILTHRNQQMLWRHYKGRASEADGLAYFGIMP